MKHAGFGRVFALRLLALCALLITAWAGVAAAEPDTTPEKAPSPQVNPAPAADAADEENNPAFHAALKEAAAGYKAWRRVDDTMRFAPTLCRAPMPSEYPPTPVRMSASADGSTHGRKLYYLYARDSLFYTSHDVATPAPQGFSIVKESWDAEAVTPNAPPTDGVVADPSGRRYHTTLDDGGVTYRVGAQRALFIMHKLDPATPGTDNGWVYGTVSPDGQTVTSAGRVASCMGCHTATKGDRLFGLPTTP